MTDYTGKTVWEATYQAWGEVESVSGSLKQPFRFQGQYFDEESGLHYNRFRYYDPSSGRFVSQDPIGLLGELNIYQYVVNPLQWIDPLGLRRLIRYKPHDSLTALTGTRNDAIVRAWADEQALVKCGSRTRNWTQQEKNLILTTKISELASVMSKAGYTGHHINSVEMGALGDKWKADPRNIVFLTNRNHSTVINEHLYAAQGHRGRWTNKTRGRLIDRKRMLFELNSNCE